MFDIVYVNADEIEARKLLDRGDITGYLTFEKDDVKIRDAVARYKVAADKFYFVYQ